LYITGYQGWFWYLVQSPQSGSALSHRLFWVLHRVHAFLAINARRSVLILVLRSCLDSIYELLAEEMCGARRDCEGGKCFVRAEAPQGGLQVRDMRHRDRKRCAGSQRLGCAAGLALKTNCMGILGRQNCEMDGWTSLGLDEYKATASSCWKKAPKSPPAPLVPKASNQHTSSHKTPKPHLLSLHV